MLLLQSSLASGDGSSNNLLHRFNHPIDTTNRHGGVWEQGITFNTIRTYEVIQRGGCVTAGIITENSIWLPEWLDELYLDEIDSLF